MTFLASFVLSSLAFGAPDQPKQPDAPLIESFLTRGELAAAEKAVNAALENSTTKDDLYLQLGTVQFLRAIEHLYQSLYSHGFGGPVRGEIPMLDIPLLKNPHPDTISYDTMRTIMETWLHDLEKAESTLAKIKSDVKMPLHFALVRLDFNGNGLAEGDETLWRIYERVNRGAMSVKDAQNILVCFDRADAVWLRGYCHLLMALDEFVLAYDFRDLFERAGHLIFAKVDSPYSFLRDDDNRFNFFGVNLLDGIAFIHTIHFPVHEPHRCNKALAHLESMTRLSREMWKLVKAETDDDHEWIPGTKQHGVIPNVQITEQMLFQWEIFLNEVDDLLAGKKLIPFWRGTAGLGVNLRHVLTEPKTFDLVLWVQGTAAAPYLEKGKLSSAETWNRLQDTFQGNFIGFAIWFN